MEITCSSCNKKINVPDEKIPKNASFSFNCPACKEKITVSPPASGDTNPQPNREGKGDGFASEPGKKNAMLCDPKPAKLKKLLEDLGYNVHTPSYHIEAVNSLRFNEYKVVMITKDYEDMPHDQASILETLQEMGMETRRKLFVTYIAPGLRSFENILAFSLSVNAVIATEDLAKESMVKEQLQHAITENDTFYRTFRECMTALGKS